MNEAFHWITGYECEWLVCTTAKGHDLEVTLIVGKGEWAWSSELEDVAYAQGIAGSLLFAMRAAQTAYLEHVKTTKP